MRGVPGGNVIGAVAFGFCFRQMAAKSAFLVMGSLIILSSILSLLIFIHGHPGLVWRTASEEDRVESSECCSTPIKMTRGPSVASSRTETAQSDASSEERCTAALHTSLLLLVRLLQNIPFYLRHRQSPAFPTLKFWHFRRIRHNPVLLLRLMVTVTKFVCPIAPLVNRRNKKVRNFVASAAK
jgi:hypothetical protein